MDNIEKEIVTWLEVKKEIIQACSCKATLIVPEIITDKAVMYVDVDTNQCLARMTIWNSGECDSEALDAKTGDRMFYEHLTFSSFTELREMLEVFFQKIHCL